MSHGPYLATVGNENTAMNTDAVGHVLVEHSSLSFVSDITTYTLDQIAARINIGQYPTPNVM